MDNSSVERTEDVLPSDVSDVGALEGAEREQLLMQGDSAVSARGHQASRDWDFATRFPHASYQPRDFLEKELGEKSGVNETGVTVGESGKDPEAAHQTDKSESQLSRDFIEREVASEGSPEGQDKEKPEAGDSSEQAEDVTKESDGALKEPASDSAGDEASEKDKDAEDEWEDILGSGQIRKKIIKKAENSHRPGQNSICEINLIGRLEDGSEVERYENLKVDLCDVEVVQGIDLVLPLMEVGELALVEVGPRFAYGTLGKEPDIPPNARMFYSLELLAAEDKPELESLPISKRKAIGIRKRERGNWWFSRQEYNFAIDCYRRAIEYLDDVTEGFSSENREEGQNIDDELQDLLENRLKVYNNLAAAQMKIKVYDAALSSVENVLRCQPQNVKALFRKGKILSSKGDTASAVAVLTAARKLEPDNSVIKQELMRCMSLLKQDTNMEKNLYKKMLGQDKPQPEGVARNQSKSRGITWGLVCGSILAMLVGALAFRYKFP